jgi:hypothetical protein
LVEPNLGDVFKPDLIVVNNVQSIPKQLCEHCCCLAANSRFNYYLILIKILFIKESAYGDTSQPTKRCNIDQYRGIFFFRSDCNFPLWLE